MPPTYSAPGSLGSQPPSFALKGTDDQLHRLQDFETARGLVVVFMCNHCPYVVAIQGRMNQLARATLSQGMAWVGINSNDSVRYPDDSFEAMKTRAQEQGFVFPYLLDETQEVAKSFGAVCTPEFFVYGKKEEQFVLQYQGRLDDNWKDESAVRQHELADAIACVLTGKEPLPDQKPAMGCSIKWKES